ncbi:MAG: hypothetical protein HGA31_01915 [Candidatus Moranbacteria bacterium]|nr:hypothetical protein [Candidatus Moranbacteria bacterium]
MAYFNEKDKIVGWENFRGSDNGNYLKSKAMEELLEKSPSLAYVCKSSGRRKIVFDAIRTHAEEGKGLRAKGLLQALGDLNGGSGLNRTETDKILREVFPAGLNDSIKREFVYTQPVKPEEIKGEEKKANSESGAGRGVESEESDNPQSKSDKNVWDYIPF